MTKGFKERQKEEKWPLPYEIYKGVKGKFGAMRIALKRPYSEMGGDGDRKEKLDGVVFLEAAPAVGPNQYDWENSKTQMALGIADLSKIIYFFKSPSKFMNNETGSCDLAIYHDPGAGSNTKGNKVKYLNFSKKPDMNNFMVNVTTKTSEKTISASVPISPEEAIAISILLEAAIPAILCWVPIGTEAI